MPAPRRLIFSVPLILGLLLAGCAGEPLAPAAPAASAVVVQPEIAGPPPLPPISAQAVLGYSRPDLVATFGAPAFSRVDKGAEILRFRGEGCVLDVFLYKDAKDAAARVAHFEARDNAGKAADRQACINRTPRARG